MKQMKAAFQDGPILRHGNPNLQYILETDTSNHAIGAVLSQIDHKGIKRPVGFLSQQMQDAQCNYPIHDKELCAVMKALEKW
jgi:hypothetical protein